MRSTHKRLELGILSLALWVVAPVSAMAGQAGPRAVYQPSMNDISIYVSKKEDTVTLSHYSAVIGAWPAKPGKESATGDKVQQGNEITPSGKLYVCTMNDKSRYYLALRLSYPNIEDAERGLVDGLINQEQYQDIVDANKAGKKSSWDTSLGRAIKIYGEQGGGTAGCTVVTNDIMDTLRRYCNLGAPATVGP